MADLTPEELVDKLSAQLAADRGEIEKYSKYYEGKQPLKYMAPQLEQELGSRITQLVINWPRLGVDAYEARLDVEGFRVTGEAKGSDRLWEIWQANDLDEVAQQAHLEALVTGRSFVIVGPGEEPGTPLITVEHPLQVTVMRDPGTRRVTAALKRWTDDDETVNATLYLENETRYYRLVNGQHELDRTIQHDRGVVPVVPLVNRPRMLHPSGVSELADVVGIADAANKMATDMMISAEFHAMPRRAWFGMTEDDFVDDNGNPLSVWSRLAGREWATALRRREEADVEQFAEADLKNFHDSIKLLAQVAGQILALPPHYMQFAAANPPSADAIRSSEAQLVKRAERKQSVFGGSWEQVMRIAARIAGIDIGDMRLLETVWRDASTPTVAQVSDASVKKLQVGIATLRQAREDCGYTDTQIKVMEEEDRQALERDPLAVFARQQEAVGAAGGADVQEGS